MAEGKRFWNECYADGKTGWDRGAVHPFMDQLLSNGILEPCKIIVPGCGRGYEVVELAKRGFDVTGIDVADEPVHQLKSQLARYHVNSRVLKTDFLDYKPAELVDVVYEQTCLCAIDPVLRDRYEETVSSWLKPGGTLFVLFAQKTESPNVGPPYHCDLGEMRQLFSKSRWDWKFAEPLEKFEHPSGRLFELSAELTRRQ